MEEYEMVGRIAELEDENAWLKGQMVKVWQFLTHASKSESHLGASAKNFQNDLRREMALRNDAKDKQRMSGDGA